MILAVVTFAMLDDIRNPPELRRRRLPDARDRERRRTRSAYQPRPPSGKALNIEVNGQRYAWRYTYPDARHEHAEQRLRLRDDGRPDEDDGHARRSRPRTSPTRGGSRQLGGKFDAVPGHLNFTWFKIPEPGVYKGQCAELCGRNHADMIAKVVAVTPAEFKTWLARKRKEIDEADKAAQTRRAQENKQTDAGASPANDEQAPEEETP